MTTKTKILRGPRAGSRKAVMQALEVGESCIFYGESGGTIQALQSSIGSAWREGESMHTQGLTQAGGLLFFEGELPTPVSRVTRVADPK